MVKSVISVFFKPYNYFFFFCKGSNRFWEGIFNDFGLEWVQGFLKILVVKWEVSSGLKVFSETEDSVKSIIGHRIDKSM